MASLRGHERREFPQSVRKAAFARSCKQCPVEGVANIPGVPQCESCGIELRSGNIEYEHIVPDGLGGEPTLENCGVWCRSSCSKSKTHTEDNPRMRKADSVIRKSFGLTPRKQKINSPGFQPTEPQRSASRPIERKTCAFSGADRGGVS
jgi:5-methylcytosine-specific restriction endonuclease McrA